MLIISHLVFFFLNFARILNFPAEMGLSQSTEVSEGGTYGYHVHGVSGSAFFIFGTACNVTAAYLHRALYANPMLANG